MNVILNPNEVATVVSIVTARVIDGVDLSEEGRDAIRAWRTDRTPGREQAEAFTDEFNEALMTHIEASTQRRYVRSGRFALGTAEERARA